MKKETNKTNVTAPKHMVLECAPQFVQVTDCDVQNANTAFGSTRYPMWFRLHLRLNAITAPNIKFFESLNEGALLKPQIQVYLTFTFNGHRTYLPWIS